MIWYKLIHFQYLRHGLIIIFLLNSCTCSHFRGMSISVKPTSQANKLEVSYRISWRRSFGIGTFCSDSTIASGTLIGFTTTMECYDGCTDSSVGTTSFVCTDYDDVEDYTTGVGSFEYVFSGASDNIYRFGYDGCSWLSLQEGGGCWKVVATVNSSIRADTGTVNQSPVTGMQPVVKLQAGCNHTITIPVSDPERDDVRCRFAKSSLAECDGICDSFPGAVLNENNCKISYTAPDLVGWYAVAVQIEDFLPGSSLALSSAPLQFLVQLINISDPCGSEPIFVDPSPADEACLAAAGQYDATIIARSPINSRSITNINTVSPPGMTKSSLQQSASSATDKYITVSWTPSAAQAGPNIFCFFAVDSVQIQSPQRCVTILAGVQLANVVPNSQSPTGLIEPTHNTWIIDFDAEFLRPGVSTFVSFYKSADDSLIHQVDVLSDANVTYPASSAGRRLTITTDVSFQEFEEYYVLLDSGIARTKYCGAASLPVSDKSFWTVKIDGDSCSDGYNNCSANADCTDLFGGFTCECKTGYMGDGYTCQDINECSSNQDNCSNNADCTNFQGGFSCMCKPGYRGDGYTCTDVNECRDDTDNCDGDADCTNNPGSFTCTCKPGFSGSGITCTDINECSSGTNNCNIYAHCGNTQGSFTCTCKSGYSGNGISCTDIHECNENTDNCSSNADCTNLIGSFSCSCWNGYTGDGYTCADINECMDGTNNCSENADCTNNPGTFTCACKPGYSGDGFTCTDINECTSGQHNCSNNADCSNIPGSFNCACLPGYTGDGYDCQDINECSSGTNNCSQYADCQNSDGSFTCSCKSGYHGNGVDCFETLTTLKPIGEQTKFPLTLQSDVSLPGNFEDVYSRDYQNVLADVLTELRNLYQRRLGGDFVGVEVTSIREGGSIIEHAVTTTTAASQQNVFRIVKDLVNKKEAINYSGAASQVSSAKIHYDGQNKTITLANVQSLSCELYESLRPCDVTYQCEMASNMPNCFPIPKADKVNIKKLAGLIAAFPMAAALIGAILTIICCVAARKRKKNKKENKKQKQENQQTTTIWTMIYPWYNGNFMLTWEEKHRHKNNSKISNKKNTPRIHI